ncbi:hypothetical protein XH87_13390 [Bradyrhizobium sp. CCBAU 53415]|nr:hypothetical protein [Bradyrhizobium sp. CCBAU 53415]
MIFFSIVADPILIRHRPPAAAAEVGLPLDDHKRSDMHIEETACISLPRSVERPPLENVIALVERAGVANGLERAFSTSVSCLRDDDTGRFASRCMEIPVVGSNTEVSGVLCHTKFDARAAVAAGERPQVRAAREHLGSVQR